ncbi:predicted protein [Streptomyces iranensis]|uniref:Uncharacterized protein n=1 Tax=Streptomyces iranensis TaxID=576784 RepID=A0A061A7F6_9ACTN|nr:predicted protein [Streptomyces iranensis]
MSVPRAIQAGMTDTTYSELLETIDASRGSSTSGGA